MSATEVQKTTQVATSILKVGHQHAFYETLPELKAAEDESKKKNAGKVLDEEVGPLFSKYGLVDTLSAVLLHNHFKLEPTEYLVTMGHVAIPVLREIDTHSKVAELNWRFFDESHDQNPKVRIGAYEYIQLPKGVEEVQIGDLKYQPFLQELYTVLKKHDLLNVIGLSIRELETPRADGKRPHRLEYTSGRSNIVIELDEEPAMGESIEAVWTFDYRRDQSAMASAAQPIAVGGNQDIRGGAVQDNDVVRMVDRGCSAYCSRTGMGAGSHASRHSTSSSGYTRLNEEDIRGGQASAPERIASRKCVESQLSGHFSEKTPSDIRGGAAASGETMRSAAQRCICSGNGIHYSCQGGGCGQHEDIRGGAAGPGEVVKNAAQRCIYSGTGMHYNCPGGGCGQHEEIRGGAADSRQLNRNVAQACWFTNHHYATGGDGKFEDIRGGAPPAGQLERNTTQRCIFGGDCGPHYNSGKKQNEIRGGQAPATSRTATRKCVESQLSGHFSEKTPTDIRGGAPPAGQLQRNIAQRCLSDLYHHYYAPDPDFYNNELRGCAPPTGQLERNTAQRCIFGGNCGPHYNSGQKEEMRGGAAPAGPLERDACQRCSTSICGTHYWFPDDSRPNDIRSGAAPVGQLERNIAQKCSVSHLGTHYNVPESPYRLDDIRGGAVQDNDLVRMVDRGCSAYCSRTGMGAGSHASRHSTSSSGYSRINEEDIRGGQAPFQEISRNLSRACTQSHTDTFHHVSKDRTFRPEDIRGGAAPTVGRTAQQWCKIINGNHYSTTSPSKPEDIRGNQAPATQRNASRKCVESQLSGHFSEKVPSDIRGGAVQNSEVARNVVQKCQTNKYGVHTTCLREEAPEVGLRGGAVSGGLRPVSRAVAQACVTCPHGNGHHHVCDDKPTEDLRGGAAPYTQRTASRKRVESQLSGHFSEKTPSDLCGGAVSEGRAPVFRNLAQACTTCAYGQHHHSCDNKPAEDIRGGAVSGGFIPVSRAVAQACVTCPHGNGHHHVCDDKPTEDLRGGVAPHTQRTASRKCVESQLSGHFSEKIPSDIRGGATPQGQVYRTAQQGCEMNIYGQHFNHDLKNPTN